jgi:HK97 family phage portal protein
MAKAQVDYLTTERAEWKEWTTENAVKEGYSVSGWVYRAVSMISRHVSSAPWHVVNPTTGEKQLDHPLTTLLNHPNAEFSTQDFFELLSAWQQLSGEAYIKKIMNDAGEVVELWPISPDRITPISGKSEKLIEGYEIINEKGVKTTSADYTTDNVISIRFLDPSDPARGIGPLQVAAKAVDVDLEQLNWNKAAMQNRGILDGIFTFQRDLQPTEYGTIKQKIKELFSGSKNARDIGVIGSNATYQRLSLTPAEMDFITLIPILDDIKDTLNFAFQDMLGAGLEVAYDVSHVPALKQTAREKGEISRMYHTMGVPVEALNEMFALGIPKYDGWDISTVTQNAREVGRQNEARSKEPTESRKKAQEILPLVTEIMDETRSKVFNAIGRSADVFGPLEEFRSRLMEFTDADSDIEALDEIATSIRNSAACILEDGIKERKSLLAIKQAMLDTEIFSESRSIEISKKICESPS